jgi:hypothetical protein
MAPPPPPPPPPVAGRVPAPPPSPGNSGGAAQAFRIVPGLGEALHGAMKKISGVEEIAPVAEGSAISPIPFPPVEECKECELISSQLGKQPLSDPVHPLTHCSDLSPTGTIILHTNHYVGTQLGGTRINSAEGQLAAQARPVRTRSCHRHLPRHVRGHLAVTMGGNTASLCYLSLKR